MSRKWRVVGLIGTVAVVLMFQTQRKVGNGEPDLLGQLSPSNADDPATRTIHYWQATGQMFRSASQSISKHNEQATLFKSGKLTTANDFQAFWKRWSLLYTEDVETAENAIVTIERLPILNVDPLVLDVATQAINYLRFRAILNKANSLDCAMYSALYADFAMAGGVVDDTTPEGQQLLTREQGIISRMTTRVDIEGRIEKQKLAEFLAIARKTRIELSAKYHVEFADINTSNTHRNEK